MTPTTLWLIAGVALMALEALGATGVGLMFAGLGALLVGMLLSFGIIDEAHVLAQWVLFFMATAAWAAMLWKPLQQFRMGKGNGYSNMVGDTAYVGASGLHKGREGEATWSGTIMKAELIPDAQVEKLEPGAAVVIVSVSGAKLIVKPKA